MALNFNDVTEIDQCPAYFAALADYPDLTTAARLTKKFRDKYPKHARGFAIDIKTITDLINQNSGDVSGIRVYMGVDETETFKAVVVATINAAYDDFNIPHLSTETSNAILGEGRPCPYECGKDNVLNKS